MGNSSSSISTNKSKLAEEIDRIASHYILSQNFNDMNKLSEKGHCDKLVILTAKIINNKLNPLEQKKMVEQELADARTELEAVQNSAKQTNAALQELMKALAAASEENDKAEMAVKAAQEKVVALMIA